MTNCLKLKAEIIRNGFTQKELANKLGISFQSINMKINNKRQFKASEISKLSKILNIANVNDIFFA